MQWKGKGPTYVQYAVPKLLYYSRCCSACTVCIMIDKIYNVLRRLESPTPSEVRRTCKRYLSSGHSKRPASQVSNKQEVSTHCTHCTSERRYGRNCTNEIRNETGGKKDRGLVNAPPQKGQRSRLNGVHAFSVISVSAEKIKKTTIGAGRSLTNYLEILKS